MLCCCAQVAAFRSDCEPFQLSGGRKFLGAGARGAVEQLKIVETPVFLFKDIQTEISESRGIPKSSILIRLSMMNHYKTSIRGTHIYGICQICVFFVGLSSLFSCEHLVIGSQTASFSKYINGRNCTPRGPALSKT